MPERTRVFILDRIFTDEEMIPLRAGHRPLDIRDKWFWYMEGDSLYIHRSLTGYCVYRIDFSFADQRHRVTSNCDPSQLGLVSMEEDWEALNKYLDRWTSQTPFSE